jgi:tetratricopeptide (TPR) repeat protein
VTRERPEPSAAALGAPKIRLLFVVLTVAAAAIVAAGVYAPRTNDTLAALEKSVETHPEDVTSWNKIAEARLRLLSSTGDLANLAAAAAALERSLKIAGPDSNRAGLALRTRVELASHRFKEAEQSAEQLRAIMPESGYPLGLLGDASLNLGEYADCERVWSEMLAKDQAVLSTEPRLAQLDLVHGRLAKAGERYGKIVEAARQLEKEAPEVLAWAYVLAGELAFRSGHWEKAGQHYDAALVAMPDYYSALEHKAELRGAQGQLDEAVALYERVIRRTARPEIMQALGDLYLFAGKTADARPWHERALKGYLASVERGEVIYFHHLAGLYADSLNEPERAVEFARRDFALRQNIQSYDTLAWTLYRAGLTSEAAETISHALVTGTKDPHILYHAGTILMRAGNIPTGTARLQEALAANPRYNSFHVHRG